VWLVFFEDSQAVVTTASCCDNVLLRPDDLLFAHSLRCEFPQVESVGSVCWVTVGHYHIISMMRA